MNQRHPNRTPSINHGHTATRWATNHNWCYRGDNTKRKYKK